MHSDDAKGTDTVAKKPRRGSPALNLGLMAIGGAWAAVLARNGEARLERWLAAGILALVGLTGILRIGAKRAAGSAAGPGDTGASG